MGRHTPRTQVGCTRGPCGRPPRPPLPVTHTKAAGERPPESPLRRTAPRVPPPCPGSVAGRLAASCSLSHAHGTGRQSCSCRRDWGFPPGEGWGRGPGSPAPWAARAWEPPCARGSHRVFVFLSTARLKRDPSALTSRPAAPPVTVRFWALLFSHIVLFLKKTPPSRGGT